MAKAGWVLALSTPSRAVEAANGAHARLCAPYAALAAIFADAGDEELDGGKVTTCWTLVDPKDGARTLFVHDRQDEDDPKFSAEKFRARASYAWHVAGASEKTVTEFCRWLSGEVRAYVRERGGRKLTAASRTKIQALIREGKSPSEATALAAEWEPAIDERQFDWPIASEVKEL
jgi:hypothetical protein